MKKIIVFEQNGLMALKIRFCLMALGYEVCASFYSGDDAVEKTMGIHPDLILINKKDGLETARNIQKHPSSDRCAGYFLYWLRN